MKIIAYNPVPDTDHPHQWWPQVHLIDDDRGGAEYHVSVENVAVNEPGLMWVTLPASWSAMQKMGAFQQLEAHFQELFGQGFDTICTGIGANGLLPENKTFLDDLRTQFYMRRQVFVDYTGTNPDTSRAFNVTVNATARNRDALRDALLVVANTPDFTLSELNKIARLREPLRYFFRDHSDLSTQNKAHTLEAGQFNVPIPRLR